MRSPARTSLQILESLPEERAMTPGLAARSLIRRSLRVEVWNDPSPGSAKEPEELPGDQKPACRAPDAERKTSPSPRSRAPPGGDRRTERSTNAPRSPERTSPGNVGPARVRAPGSNPRREIRRPGPAPLVPARSEVAEARRPARRGPAGPALPVPRPDPAPPGRAPGTAAPRSGPRGPARISGRSGQKVRARPPRGAPGSPPAARPGGWG